MILKMKICDGTPIAGWWNSDFFFFFETMLVGKEELAFVQVGDEMNIKNVFHEVTRYTGD